MLKIAPKNVLNFFVIIEKITNTAPQMAIIVKPLVRKPNPIQTEHLINSSLFSFSQKR